MNGLLLVDKPVGMSSHDVVAKVRRHLGIKQVGHAGTLDPAASGLLVILVGQATKLSNYILNGDKAYEVEILLGVRTTTGDQEGEVTETRSVENLSEEVVLEQALGLNGTFHWPIPIYSAKRVKGKKLYEIARSGAQPEGFEIPKKDMSFEQVEVISQGLPRLKVRFSCSKGSFVRTWAEQLGEALGCGASVIHLRRILSSPFNLNDSNCLDKWLRLVPEEWAGVGWIPMEEALPHLQTLCVDGRMAHLIRHGQVPHALSRSLEVDYLSRGIKTIQVRQKGPRTLLAILEYDRNRFKIKRVFKDLPN